MKGEAVKDEKQDNEIEQIQLEFSNLILNAYGQKVITIVCLSTSILYLTASCTRIVLCVVRRINNLPREPGPVRGYELIRDYSFFY